MSVPIAHKKMYTRRCSTPGIAGKATVMCGMARSCVTSQQVLALMHVAIVADTHKEAEGERAEDALAMALSLCLARVVTYDGTTCHSNCYHAIAILVWWSTNIAIV